MSHPLVLVTGAFGNLGPRLLEALARKGWRIRATDLDTTAARKTAARLRGICEGVVWSDIRRVDFDALLDGVSAVVHLAAMLPPATERHAELARAVNLDAGLALIEAIERRPEPPRLIFPSSVTVFGLPLGKALRRASEVPRATDNYTRWKVALEERLAGSSIPWCVLRVGVSVDGNLPATDKEMTLRQFDTAADNPVEYVHPADVATAVVNALDSAEAVGRILLLGGGPTCRVTQYDLLAAPFAAMGVELPRAMLGSGAFYTHWMDTEESQRILQFQRLGFDDFRAELTKTVGRWRPLLAPLAPLVLWGLRRYLRAG